MDACQTENRIAERREALGRSRYWLAKRAGIKWETLRDIEVGARKPNSKTAAKIERALKEATS
jgi:ribosome-binding protein aMBF1 (putative translation factor)